MPSKRVNKVVTWLSEEITNAQNVSNSFHYYEKFQYQDLIAKLGEFVLVSNADYAEPDTEEGCDAAQILTLYEDTYNKSDPFRAKVQWYSKPIDLPSSCFMSTNPVSFIDRELVQDHRPFDTDVSIETFFKTCHISLNLTKDDRFDVIKPYHYICRYRFMPVSKRKGQLEPVLEQERNALQLLATPHKNVCSPRHVPKTPSSLIKKMSQVSLIEQQKNWSISKNDGTRLLLKRAILTDKTEKESPKRSIAKSTPKTKKSSPEIHTTTNYKRNLTDDLILAELQENSDDELPTLIIRRVSATPKRKQSISKTINDTPKKVLIFEEEDKDTYLTRSGRVTKQPANYKESDLSPEKKPQRRLIHKIKDDEVDDFEPIPRTPRATRTPKTPITPKTPRGTPSTPKGRKRVATSQLTPSLRTRVHSVDNLNDFMKENKCLPGRESQMEEILSFVRNKLLDNVSGCMYISGVPGTGKTATVTSALSILKEAADLPDFQLVEVNGMKISEPRQAYVQIFKQLTGKTVVWEQACSLLERRFTKPMPRRTPTVLVVDELDALCNRRQDVLYSIMEWSTHDSALLSVLAVANTMDLPERALASRVASRLGLTRLTFPPYTHTQLQTIVASRLINANVTPDALQLIARKVAAVSGDARRALALCRRALELAGKGRAGLPEVQLALNEAASSATVRAIRACSAAERLMLRAVAAEVERTGSDETTLSRALSTAGAIVSLDGRPYRSAPHIRPPTPSQAHAICTRLAANRLLLLDARGAEPKVILNVSPDDVHYATKQICVYS